MRRATASLDHHEVSYHWPPIQRRPPLSLFRWPVRCAHRYGRCLHHHVPCSRTSSSGFRNSDRACSQDRCFLHLAFFVHSFCFWRRARSGGLINYHSSSSTQDSCLLLVQQCNALLVRGCRSCTVRPCRAQLAPAPLPVLGAIANSATCTACAFAERAGQVAAPLDYVRARVTCRSRCLDSADIPVQDMSASFIRTAGPDRCCTYRVCFVLFLFPVSTKSTRTARI